MDKETSFWRLPLQIAAGVVIFCLFAALVQTVVLSIVAYQAQQSSMVDSERELRQSQELYHQRAQEARAKADSLQAAADQVRIQADADRRKAVAWAEFYHQPVKCDRPADFDVNIECGNAYIRAKREFEAKWGSN